MEFIVLCAPNVFRVMWAGLFNAVVIEQHNIVEIFTC